MSALRGDNGMTPVNALVVTSNGRKVGDLYRAEARGIFFTYDRSWLADGFNLSPFTMVFDDRPQLAQDNLFAGLHGPFADSLPDGWGHLLMDRFHDSVIGAGTSRRLTPLDRLAYMGDRGMGALGYHPEADRDELVGQVDLARLFEASVDVQVDETAEVLRSLRLAGGSPGGARPKAIVALSPDGQRAVSAFAHAPDGYEHCIVKFRSVDESRATGSIEQAYAVMAAEAGVAMAPSRLLDLDMPDGTTERFFTTLRFDRVGDRKVHMMTASALLYADFRMPSMDYGDLLRLTDGLTKSAAEVEKMARLMVFNALSHNYDDHTKNFSYLCDTGNDGQWRWQLAPAYDLTFSEARGEHSTSFAGRGKATRDIIRTLCRAYRYLRPDDYIDQTLSALARWNEAFDALGIPLAAGEGMFRVIGLDHAAFESKAR